MAETDERPVPPTAAELKKLEKDLKTTTLALDSAERLFKTFSKRYTEKSDPTGSKLAQQKQTVELARKKKEAADDTFECASELAEAAAEWDKIHDAVPASKSKPKPKKSKSASSTRKKRMVKILLII